MNDTVKVGFKLCGNCNPQIPKSEIFQAIKNAIAKFPWVEQVPREHPNLDLLIVLSGCPVDCAVRPPDNYHQIIVAGESINHVNYRSEEIPAKVIEMLKSKRNSIVT